MSRKSAKTWGALSVTALAPTFTACSNAGGSENSSVQGNGDTITLEFAQWWEPELPDNSLRGLMDEFEKDNSGIKVKLLSGSYASTREQIVVGAAAGIMSDVVDLDGAWVNDSTKQGATANLSDVMKEAPYDDSKLVNQVKMDDETYSIPVTNFVYPVFVNRGILDRAEVKEVPKAREEFAKAAKVVTNDNIKGWILPLSLEAPNGVQNDVIPWVWASGGSMLKDGKPFLEGNKDVEGVVTYIKKLWDDQVITPDALTMKEQDKVEEFTSGRVAMMIDSLTHVNLIRRNNPDLKFDLSPLPARASYDGERGMPFASWGIGISADTKHPEQAWELVKFLLSGDISVKLCDAANALPGNKDAKPSFIEKNEILAKAFEIWDAGVPANEFTGLSVAKQLMREFDGGLQQVLSENANVSSVLKDVESEWNDKS